VALDLTLLPAPALAFLTERHLATLSTLRADGTPHVVPVGFTYDPDRRTAWVITSGSSRKAQNVAAGGGGARVALCQVDGWRWVTLEGAARLVEDPEAVRAAEAAYTSRYRPPRPNPHRVVLEVAVDRAMGLVERPGR